MKYLTLVLVVFLIFEVIFLRGLNDLVLEVTIFAITLYLYSVVLMKSVYNDKKEVIELP
jgi:hypothetical protein